MKMIEYIEIWWAIIFCGKVLKQDWVALMSKLIVKTQRNSTQLKTTLKQLALELDIVVTCSPPPPYHKLFSHF